jgi:hypothetical protein
MSEQSTNTRDRIQVAPTPEFIARALLIAALVAALGSALASVAQLALGGNWAFLIAYCAIVAFAAQWSTWFLTERLPQSFDRHWFRAGELGLLIILGILGDALIGGRVGELGSLLSLGIRPVILVLLSLGAWSASVATARDFARLGEPPERDALYVPPLEGLTRRFFIGGALLVATVGITTVGPGRLLEAGRAAIGGPILAALVYFPVGLALLALAQHTLLERRWEAEKTTIAAGLGGRWARISLIFMVLTMALAFILPTAYGLGLLDLLALVLRALIWLLAILGIGATAPLFLLLARLDGSGAADTTPPAPAAPPPPPPPVESTGFPLLDLLRWTLFAVLAAALAFWLLRGWLDNRALLRGAIGRGGPLTWLRGWLAAIMARLRGLATTIGERLPRRSTAATRARSGTGERLGRFLPARDPRTQVIRYYFSLIRRAGAQGFGRGASQTPQEYAARLAPHVPEAGADLDGLTTDFIEARYSRHDITAEQSGRARGRWERVRDALRQRQRADEARSVAATQGIPRT